MADNTESYYIDPTFNPALLPKKKRAARIEVTMMLPFSVQCTTCSEFMSKGKKYNAKVEAIPGAEYLGLKVWRFIGKCTGCNGPFSIKTDPAAMDYAVEAGCKRNFEPWRDNAAEQEAARAAREAEERDDTMKAMENRTLESKRQMEAADALEEMRVLRARQAKLLADPDALLAALVVRVGDREGGGEGEGDGGEGSGEGTGEGGGEGGAAAAAAALLESVARDAAAEAEDEELVARLFAGRRKLAGGAAAAGGAGADGSAGELVAAAPPVLRRIIGSDAADAGVDGVPSTVSSAAAAAAPQAAPPLVASIPAAIAAPRLRQQGVAAGAPAGAPTGMLAGRLVRVRPRDATSGGDAGAAPGDVAVAVCNEGKRPRTESPPPPPPAPAPAAPAPRPGLVAYGDSDDSDST